MPVCLSCKKDLTYYYFKIRVDDGICRACTAPRIIPVRRKKSTHKKNKKIPLPQLTVPDIDPAQFRQVFQ